MGGLDAERACGEAHYKNRIRFMQLCVPPRAAMRTDPDKCDQTSRLGRLFLERSPEHADCPSLQAARHQLIDNALGELP